MFEGVAVLGEVVSLSRDGEGFWGSVAELSPSCGAALWAYVAGLFEAPDLSALRRAALDVRTVIPGSTTYFTEVDLVSGEIHTISDPPSACTPALVSAYMGLRHESPVVQRFEQAGGDTTPLAVSDLVDERSFVQTSLYRDLGLAVGVRDQLAIRVPLPRTMTSVSLSVGRDGWGFTAAEHVAAGVIQRALRATYGALWQRESARAAKGTASSLLARSGAEVCVVGRFGEIVGLDGGEVSLDPLVSSAISTAGRLAGRAGPTQAAAADGPCATTPEPGRVVAELHVRDSSGDPVMVQLLASDDGEFWPVMLKRSSPKITVENLTARGLTRRQAEVMSLLLGGRTTAGAALDLGISPRTAEKHVYAAIEALGFHRRTDALISLASGITNTPPDNPVVKITR